MQKYSPQRIVCLTEESTELLYLLGEQDRIVGISGFTVRPENARKEKPKVSLFTDASYDEILALQPDLVIGFSDIQAGIASELIKKGLTVWVNNHRTLEETFQFIWQLGVLVDRKAEVEKLISSYQNRIAGIKERARQLKRRPRVYFEEWFDPLISGISWVSEIIQIAGGDDIFPEFANQSLAKDRIIGEQAKVIERDPEIILASWCGKMFKKKKLLARDGWEKIEAVKKDEIHEIHSSIILQPGPAALTEGLESIHQIILDWEKKQ